MMAAFAAGDMETARAEQFRGVELIRLLAGYGYMAAAKAVMEMLGVAVGAPRLPQAPLSAGQRDALRNDLETLGFFSWIR
jgi:N-acetylneuraminate lyase